MMRIGVISDTHGLLRAEVLDALRGSDHIIHAGDVGDPTILDTLGQIAPFSAVRGNVDRGVWGAQLPFSAVVPAEETLLYVLHIREELDLDPVAAGFRAVIFGHSHRPLLEEKRGVLYLNPGSAGHRRFRLPVSLAQLRVDGARVEAEIIQLEVD